jgi:predicted DNA-binding transcriptional regulator AlpA
MNLLTTKDLQEMLKVTAVTIWRWRKEGMPFQKIGNSIRFKEKEVFDWLNNKGERTSKGNKIAWDKMHNEEHYLRIVDRETGEQKDYTFPNFQKFCEETYKIINNRKENEDVYFSSESMLKEASEEE